MRPTTKTVGEVGRLLDEWREGHELRPNRTQLANLLGVSTSLVSAWRLCESMMQPDDMDNVAKKTGISYGVLAEALRADTPRILEHNATRRSGDRPPRGPRRQRAD